MRFTLLVVLCLVSVSSQAAQSWIRGADIKETLVDTNRFGQCMVRLQSSVDIPSYLPLCKSQYLTFDCGAELPGSTRINSLEKFESATVA